jgi:hypothetical protein
MAYRLLVSWLEDRANTKLEFSLDNGQYNQLDKIVLKIPITHLSYYNSSLEFIRQDGKIDIDGNAYRFVKMRLRGDSVEIVCVPDYPRRNSLALQEHFVRWNTDSQQSEQGRKSGNHHRAYKIITSEYDTAGRQSIPAIPCIFITKKIVHYHFHIAIQSSPVIENPPEPLC